MDRKHFWDSKPWQAFKTFAVIFSFVINLVVLIILLIVMPLILPIVNEVVNPLVSDLNTSFVEMNDATIRRTIQVSDTIPVVLEVPLSTETTVVVQEAVPLANVPAQFILPGGGGMINGQVSLNLPEGLALPVQLDLRVPISETLPVQLAVEAIIPLNETDLGDPFNRLVDAFAPLYELLDGLPDSNEDFFGRVTGSISPADSAAAPDPIGAAPEE